MRCAERNWLLLSFCPTLHRDDIVLNSIFYYFHCVVIFFVIHLLSSSSSFSIFLFSAPKSGLSVFTVCPMAFFLLTIQWISFSLYVLCVGICKSWIIHRILYESLGIMMMILHTYFWQFDQLTHNDVGKSKMAVDIVSLMLLSIFLFLYFDMYVNIANFPPHTHTLTHSYPHPHTMFTIRAISICSYWLCLNKNDEIIFHALHCIHLFYDD